jgi:hypothetical protein
MTIKQEVYNNLSQKGIFLTAHQLDKTYDQVTKRLNNKESIFTILRDLENDSFLKSFNDSKKGAYKLTNEHQTWSKKSSSIVIKCDPETGDELQEYKSLYAAAASCGKYKGASNIKKSCELGGIGYGFKWKYKNK